jgi:hypothetical protein
MHVQYCSFVIMVSRVWPRKGNADGPLSHNFFTSLPDELLDLEALEVLQVR